MFAYLFPGQGSQFVGMGSAFVAASPAAKKRIEEANDALGFDLGGLMTNGPEEELGLTANTQPAILVASVIACDALRAEDTPPPTVAAGHSLGEFSACWSAGALAFTNAVRLVRRRGELMQSAVPVGEGGMAAIIGLTADQVTALCNQQNKGVNPANFNSPEQTVVAGPDAAVVEFVEMALEAGAKKGVKLTVSAPFHTAFMKPAQEGLAEFMESISFNDPVFPIIRNVDAGLSTCADDVKQGLIKQVTGCVSWVASMEVMAGRGVTAALELGPGKVLMGLQRRINRAVKVTPVGGPDDIAKGKAAITA